MIRIRVNEAHKIVSGRKITAIFIDKANHRFASIFQALHDDESDHYEQIMIHKAKLLNQPGWPIKSIS